MEASFARRHQAGSCKHHGQWSAGTQQQEQDKEGMREQIQGEGVTQGMAWEGKRLPPSSVQGDRKACREGVLGERAGKAGWLQQQEHFG